MLHIGCHLSSSKGYRHMGEDALSINADTFQFFTRNPRGSKAKKADPKDAEALRGLMEEHAFAPVLGHAPYTLNACALDEGLRAFARDAMREDVMTLDTYLPHMLYNFHPGSHVGQGIDAGMALIVELLQHPVKIVDDIISSRIDVAGVEAHAHLVAQRYRAEDMPQLLETASDLGPLAGHGFQQDAGGLLRTQDRVQQFDRHVGLGKLYAIHLNDSLMPFASRKDRHARIGEGTIGLEAIARIINHPALRHLPFYLETPNELPGYAHEISVLRAAWIE